MQNALIILEKYLQKILFRWKKVDKFLSRKTARLKIVDFSNEAINLSQWEKKGLLKNDKFEIWLFFLSYDLWWPLMSSRWTFLKSLHWELYFDVLFVYFWWIWNFFSFFLQFLTLNDLEWPRDLLVWNFYVKAFILRYNLSPFGDVQNLTPHAPKCPRMT